MIFPLALTESENRDDNNDEQRTTPIEASEETSTKVGKMPEKPSSPKPAVSESSSNDNIGKQY